VAQGLARGSVRIKVSGPKLPKLAPPIHRTPGDAKRTCQLTAASPELGKYIANAEKFLSKLSADREMTPAKSVKVYNTVGILRKDRPRKGMKHATSSKQTNT
jgi:hypothetical protein